MQAQTIGEWIDALASEEPTPGGGAAAAMNAAIGAALVAMVCNLTIGKPRYAAHEHTMIKARDRASELRRRALALADADARAFDRVVAAYRLPKETESERLTRTATIQQALIDAAIPLETAAVAAEVINLAVGILDGANINVITDVAVAASSARAALDAATVNVEVNLSAMHDAEQREKLAQQLAEHARAATQANAVVASVRARMGR